jgi:hypothetical protein
MGQARGPQLARNRKLTEKILFKTKLLKVG